MPPGPARTVGAGGAGYTYQPYVPSVSRLRIGRTYRAYIPDVPYVSLWQRRLWRKMNNEERQAYAPEPEYSKVAGQPTRPSPNTLR